MLERDDVDENEAAAFVARSLAGTGASCSQPFTGRCNLIADVAGIVLIDAAVINAVNAEDEAILVATTQLMQPVRRNEMVAAVKIVPFAVPSSLLQRALMIAVSRDAGWRRFYSAAGLEAFGGRQDNELA